MGHLFCLDGATGGVVWEKSLAQEYRMKEFTGITASPLSQAVSTPEFAGGRLLVAGLREPPCLRSQRRRARLRIA